MNSNPGSQSRGLSNVFTILTVPQEVYDILNIKIRATFLYEWNLPYLKRNALLVAVGEHMPHSLSLHFVIVLSFTIAASVLCTLSVYVSSALVNILDLVVVCSYLLNLTYFIASCIFELAVSNKKDF